VVKIRVLITGGSGFIATNFFHYILDKKDIEIRLFDRRYGQDLTKWEDVDTAWQWKPDLVINFASHTSVDLSIKYPSVYWNNNLELMFNVLEACRKYDSRLCQISSCEVYGEAQYIPQDEKHPFAPCSPYGATKVAQDRACHAWFKSYGLDVIIVRPFNLYGPYQATEKLIPKFIKKILDGLPLPVYGDGSAKRDWIYVEDVCSGIWDASLKLPKGEAINLATGKSYSVREISNYLKDLVPKLSGRPNLSKIVTVHEIADRPGHIYLMEGSYAKAKELIGWEPRHSIFEGLTKTIKWYLTNQFRVPLQRTFIELKMIKELEEKNE